MSTVVNPDGRPRLLDLIDQSDGLRPVMEFNVLYSLADRTCERCRKGRSKSVGESVALVKVHNSAHPLGHLVALCAAHADKFEPSSDTQG